MLSPNFKFLPPPRPRYTFLIIPIPFRHLSPAWFDFLASTCGII
jgi:hypothetical protein